MRQSLEIWYKTRRLWLKMPVVHQSEFFEDDLLAEVSDIG